MMRWVRVWDFATPLSSWPSRIVGGTGYQLVSNDQVGSLSTHVGTGVVASFAYALIAWNNGLYKFTALLQPRRDYGRMLVVWLLVVLLLVLMLFLFKLSADISRGSIISFVMAGFVALVAWRRAVKWMVRIALASGSISGRRVMLVGTRNELAPLRPENLLAMFGLKEISRAILPDHDVADPVISSTEIDALGAAIEQARMMRTEEVIVALPWGNPVRLDFVREQLRVLPLPVRLMPDLYVRSIWACRSPLEAAALLVDVQRAPLTRTELATKRVFDVVIAAAMLFVLFPLLLVIGMAVMLESPGPMIFRQRRRGFNGRDFVIHKFRTMTVMEDGDTIPQASRRDPRITPLGRMLRRSSIDELPQLLNVLKGDMSLVGPRPHAVAHDKEYGASVGNYAFRHHVKPGITGWAQVNGFRGETPNLDQMRKRVEFDIWYINNWSVLLDFQILARTCIEVGRSGRAY